MKRLTLLAGLVALSGACFAAAPAARAHSPQAPAGTPAAQGLPKVCLDIQTGDPVTQAFADRLRQAIAASGALTLGSTGDSCSLQLHVPGNLLRFETSGGVMISTVVIVTSTSGRYLSTSITACQANDLKPCAARAIAVAKLTLLTNPNG